MRKSFSKTIPTAEILVFKPITSTVYNLYIYFNHHYTLFHCLCLNSVSSWFMLFEWKQNSLNTQLAGQVCLNFERFILLENISTVCWIRSFKLVELHCIVRSKAVQCWSRSALSVDSNHFPNRNVGWFSPKWQINGFWFELIPENWVIK